MNDPPPDLSPAGLPDGLPRSLWQRLANRVHRLFHPRPDAEALREAVEELIEEPSSESGLSPAERLLLANVMNLRERKAGDCMVPRADIIASSLDTPLKELIDLMAAHAHSRIPVYRETLDDVIGMVHMKDIIPCIAHGQNRTIADLLRPVMFVAPSTPAARLLLQMRQTRQHMALVVDEFGGIDGLVTIEDLVEEVVGEIEDEHDAPTAASIIARADGTLLVDARLPIEEFEERTGVDLDPAGPEDVDTLGGYVGNLAGRMPHIGESFKNVGGISFEVIEMDQSRIKRLRIKGLRRQEAAPAAREAHA
ncbi:MAG TPA: hemolysin family protein [Alphaproteobacteria bacterium]|nr:hemolysin family protein [Alphaproteobacteria bacterium]